MVNGQMPDTVHWVDMPKLLTTGLKISEFAFNLLSFQEPVCLNWAFKDHIPDIVYCKSDGPHWQEPALYLHLDGWLLSPLPPKSIAMLCSTSCAGLTVVSSICPVCNSCLLEARIFVGGLEGKTIQPDHQTSAGDRTISTRHFFKINSPPKVHTLKTQYWRGHKRSIHERNPLWFCIHRLLFSVPTFIVYLNL